MISFLFSETNEDIVIIGTPTTLNRILMINSDDIKNVKDRKLMVKAIILSKTEEQLDSNDLIDEIFFIASDKNMLGAILTGDSTLFIASIPNNMTISSDYDTGILIRNVKLRNLFEKPIRNICK